MVTSKLCPGNQEFFDAITECLTDSTVSCNIIAVSQANRFGGLAGGLNRRLAEYKTINYNDIVPKNSLLLEEPFFLYRTLSEFICHAETKVLQAFGDSSAYFVVLQIYPALVKFGGLVGGMKYSCLIETPKFWTYIQMTGEVMSLTDTQCRTAKPQDKNYRLYDTMGLYLEVFKTGTRSWKQKYRYGEKEKRLTHGNYPNLSLADARKLASEAKDNLSKGVDPALLKKSELHSLVISSEHTFKQLGDEWLEINRPQWKERYYDTIHHRLEKYVYPFFGNIPMRMIKPMIVLARLQEIEKTAPEMARRVMKYCRQIFKFAIVTDRAVNDPTYGLEVALKKYKKGHFAAIGVDELPQFLIDLHNYQSRIKRQTYLAIRLMLLTFVRTSELIEATWDEVDFEKSLWIIPGDRMKKSLPHIIPLSNQAVRILKELKETTRHSKYLLPSFVCVHEPMSKGTILVALDRMGYRGKMTGHGFRSLALGTLKEKLNVSHEIADRQLAHVRKTSTDRAYDRAQFLPQRTIMMQEYANYLDMTLLRELQKEMMEQLKTAA